MRKYIINRIYVVVSMPNKQNIITNKSIHNILITYMKCDLTKSKPNRHYTADSPNR